VGLLAFGGPLFHALLDAPSEAPAALAGVLIPLGLPLLGGYALIRFTTEQWPSLPPDWRSVWTLLGLLGLLACSASATGTTRIRQLIGWQFSAQMGLVLIAIGLNGGLPPLAAAAGLLMNAALTALVCYLALAVLERRAGTDDLAQIGAHGPLTLPGLAFLFAAASSVGIPGTWGWWTQSALIDGLRYTTPWLVPLLLAGNALRALAYVAPLAAFWRAAEARPVAQAITSRRGWPTIAALLCPAVATLPLLVWGIAPQLAWNGWLGPIQRLVIADGPELSTPDIPTQIAVVLAAFALVALPLLAGRGRARREPAELDLRNMALLTPQALGQSLHGLSWLGDSAGLFRSIWDGLLRLSRATTRLLALFEQRYYLAGLMIALIVVIMLFF
jgi:formate hydrogenlyase subunit 3/multisubunit Na+/H+ antiporter MnhD subunit